MLRVKYTCAELIGTRHSSACLHPSGILIFRPADSSLLPQIVRVSRFSVEYHVSISAQNNLAEAPSEHIDIVSQSRRFSPFSLDTYKRSSTWNSVKQCPKPSPLRSPSNTSDHKSPLRQHVIRNPHEVEIKTTTVCCSDVLRPSILS